MWIWLWRLPAKQHLNRQATSISEESIIQSTEERRIVSVYVGETIVVQHKINSVEFAWIYFIFCPFVLLSNGQFCVMMKPIYFSVELKGIIITSEQPYVIPSRPGAQEHRSTGWSSWAFPVTDNSFIGLSTDWSSCRLTLYTYAWSSSLPVSHGPKFKPYTMEICVFCGEIWAGFVRVPHVRTIEKMLACFLLIWNNHTGCILQVAQTTIALAVPECDFARRERRAMQFHSWYRKHFHLPESEKIRYNT